MAGSCDTDPSNIQVNDDIDWSNVKNQVQLLLALMGHKPVGVAKHFQMALILEKFSNAIQRFDISSKVIWDRLDTMYDLQALEETEAIPFPNDTQDFSLPEDFGHLVEQKRNGTMPPPRVPSPPPDVKKKDIKDIKKEPVKDINPKKDIIKEVSRKIDDKKTIISVKDIKKETKEDIKKDKRQLREGSEDKKKDKEVLKGKESSLKEQRGTKQGIIVKDDEDSSVSSSGSLKRGREKDSSDTDEAISKRSSLSTTSQIASGKGKRQTRLSHAKVSDDSGSNKSVSPVPVQSPKAKRRRHV